MKVTVVADVLGPENNGTTVACMNLVRYLKKCGDEVKVVCCDKDKKDLENYYIVDTINLGYFINKLVEKNNVTLAKPDKVSIDEAIKGSDVVHVMMPFMLGRCAVREANRLGIPVTAGFHCQAENFTSHIMMMNSNLVNHIVYNNFYNGFYKYVDAIHYPTEFIKDLFEKEVKHSTPAHVISNGVNEAYSHKIIEKPEELRDKFCILFIGRYSKEKSHRILIDAVSKSKYKDKIQLIFAGEGPRKDEILRQVKKLKINEPIMKFYTRSELANVINYCDLYCHPAEIEIEAISCLEAISCGLVPVISNSPRCATKYFAKDDRCLFENNDSNDLANKIDFWIENEQLKKEYSQYYLNSTIALKQDECMKSMREMLTCAISKEA
ncbi:MAG: glycosyltransferase [Clostridia bacterium]|nr:glycosyltransferase [Clostridia bacterium]